MNLQIPKDNFSDGQVCSKFWSVNPLSSWDQQYLNPSLNLVELDQDALRNSACKYLMARTEYINGRKNLIDFKNIYSSYIQILELSQLDFFCPNQSFSRFMMFGKKCN